MDASRRFQQTKDGDVTKAKVTKSCGKQSNEKPALSTIEEEETDSPDSSEDSAINFRGIEPEASAKNYPYDLRVSLVEDYEEVLRDRANGRGATEDKTAEEGKKQLAETPPFLTARNGSDHEAGSKSGDSNSTASYERSTPDDYDYEDEDDDDDDDDEDVDQDDWSIPGESSSGDVDYDANDRVDDPPCNLQQLADNTSLLESSKKQYGTLKMKEIRPNSAPDSAVIATLDAHPDARLLELSTTLDWLKAKLLKSEKDIHSLKKQLSREKSRNSKFVQRYDDDRNVTKESLRIDLELWIKKLNDGLKDYLAEWQQRERLRLNEEISRISDIYSQEIAKSLKSNLKEWQIEDSKKLFELMDKRDKSRHDKERASANAIYEKIQNHLENLEKRNRKSYASFRKQIDKWEDRLREEVVKLRDEDLKKMRQQVDVWHEDEQRRQSLEPAAHQDETKERCNEKQCCGFPGARELMNVEENLLKRLRESSTKDLRRTEQIVRTELKAQRRELAKRMNDKIAELWMAFEDFGFGPSALGVDRTRLKRSSSVMTPTAGRNDLEDRRGKTGSAMKDSLMNPDVFGARWGPGKIVTRPSRPDGSTRSSSTDIEDGDRDYREDDDDDESLLEEASEKSVLDESKISSTLPASNVIRNSTTMILPTADDVPDPREDVAREVATTK